MSWFSELTGLTDDRPETVREGITCEGEWLFCLANGRRMRAGRLSTPSLGELRADLPVQSGVMQLEEIVSDIRDLHCDPANAGAMFQVASQFNLLEMISPDVTPDAGIARYSADPTQGPACAIACAAGTIWRNYLLPMDCAAGPAVQGQSAACQLDMMADLGQGLGNDQGELWRMQNGYLLPRPGALSRINTAIRGRESHLRDLIRVGLQQDTEVTLRDAGHIVHQLYASALPVSYAGQSGEEWEPFARLVLEAAYEATFAACARLSLRKLYLTRLGGGAFGNHPDWINGAILSAAHRCPVPGLQVFIVSHSAPNPQNQALLRSWKRH